MSEWKIEYKQGGKHVECCGIKARWIVYGGGTKTDIYVIYAAFCPLCRTIYLGDDPLRPKEHKAGVTRLQLPESADFYGTDEMRVYDPYDAIDSRPKTLDS